MINDLRDIQPAVAGIADTLSALATARGAAERVAKSLVRLTAPNAPVTMLAHTEMDIASGVLCRSLRSLTAAALAAPVVDGRDVEALLSIMNQCVAIFGIGDPDVARLSLTITAAMSPNSSRRVDLAALLGIDIA